MVDETKLCPLCSPEEDRPLVMVNTVMGQRFQCVACQAMFDQESLDFFKGGCGCENTETPT